MKEATCSATEFVCNWCGVILEDGNGASKIDCANCDNNFSIDDEIICCDDELPRSKENPIGADEALHYCNDDCYKEHQGKREQYYKGLVQKKKV